MPGCFAKADGWTIAGNRALWKHSDAGNDLKHMKASEASVNIPVCWNFRHLGAALFIGFIIQNIFLSCLCSIGTAKMALAFSFDSLVLLRMAWAYFRRETGKGWMVYAILCYTSAAWVEGVTFLVLGDT